MKGDEVGVCHIVGYFFCIEMKATVVWCGCIHIYRDNGKRMETTVVYWGCI